MRNMSIAFGSYMPMKMAIERSFLGSCRRGPGLPSSHLGLHLAMGTYDEMTMGDFMTRPDESPYLPKEDVHTMFEQSYGMNE